MLLCQELKNERKALLAERDALALRVVQLEKIVLQLTGTIGEPSQEPCIASTVGIPVESDGDDLEETCKESKVSPLVNSMKKPVQNLLKSVQSTSYVRSLL